MTVRPLGAARLDVLDAADWYDIQSPGVGDRFLDAVDRTVDRIAGQPRTGWRPVGAPRHREVRETLVDGFPFRLVYEVRSNEVVILSVTHASRKRRTWRRRL